MFFVPEGSSQQDLIGKKQIESHSVQNALTSSSYQAKFFMIHILLYDPD